MKKTDLKKFSLKRIIPTNQRGDTILEVLIAVSVLSLILVISFSLSNRSTQGIRQSQERGEASRQTEGQMELLKKYLSDSASPTLPGEGAKFCMKADGSPTVSISSIPDDAQAEISSTFNAFNSYPECKDGTSVESTYYTYIQRGTGVDKNTFTAHTRWNKVTGDGIDEATMVHKIYPDLASVDAGAGNTVGCSANFEVNSFGNCVPCPTGFTNPAGVLTPCSPVKPQIRVIVKRVTPPVPAAPVGCGGASAVRGGVPVTLTGSGGPFTGSSTALFNVPGFSSTYSASITVPAGHTNCSPSSQSVTSTPIGTVPSPPVDNNVRTITFTIVPNCTYVQDWGWVDYGSWQPSYTWQLTGTWWAHTGPDWGPWGPPSSNPRWGIGDAKNGYPGVYFDGAYPNRNQYQLHHVEGAGGWYNRFVEQPVYGWVHTGWYWAANWQNVVIGSHYNCTP